MTLNLHPSEIRPPAPRRSAAKKVLLAVQVGAGLACATASFAGGALLLSRLSEEPAAKVTFTRIEDWPEIKNGVPDLLAARPSLPEPPAPEPLPPELRGSPHPERETVAESPSPAPEPSAAPSVPASAAAQSAPPISEGETEADVPVNAAAAPPAVPSGEPPQLAETPAAQPAPAPLPAVPAQTAKERSDPPKVRAAASNPAPAKARAAEKTASASKPKPKPRQKVAAAQPAPQAAPAPAESATPAPPPEDDSLDVLGMRVPNLLPSRRKIREAIESLGL